MKLFQLIDYILTAMKVEVGSGVYSLFLRWLNPEVLPDVLRLFILAIVLAALLIGAVLAVHLLISLIRKRRTRVFISFHHEREPIADMLANEMTKRGIRAERLPFVERPDHDMLILQMTQEIRDCDICVCVPGNRPSVVDSEVFALSVVRKPILFVLIEADAPHLPNLAMKGYPVFALERLQRLQRKGFRTLANFCSYLAADWRSTVRLYGAVFHHLKACAELVVAVFIVSIVILTNVIGSSKGRDVANSPERRAAQIAEERARKPIYHLHTIDEHIFWVLGPPLILFFVPYILFFITRLTLRAELRRVICGKKFRDTFIPETLAYSLTRADLLKILYHGEIVAHHESGRPACT